MHKMSDYWKTDELFNLNCFREKMTDEETPSRIYKVEKVLDYFNKRMHDVYQPCTNLSLDESMVLWRSGLLFRQYIINKRHKYGVTLYMLTEKQGLVQQIMIYSGKVLVCCPDVKLAHQLLQRKTYCTGTLRIRKYTKDGICVVKWKDKRDVLCISSELKNKMVETTNRHGIDRQDQMMSYYPAERKTLRWYKKIAIHFL
ncbi:piggyBac transposable element-derived protein 4-like [Aphis craccivora]|uniref:PiggyBac transposable element-derived protein 4-like n=1 Tax=Aphis craccivora TaxID=307492 RepID=A0A6G0Y0V2_APHCR|nr:piggyBac transposable element-derived protein 4-like [Aphis craccivora]